MLARMGDTGVVSRADRAKSWCLLMWVLHPLLVLAEDVFSINGTLWEILRLTVSALFATALTLWIVLAYRERRGREWLVPVGIAAALVASAVLVSLWD
jgi:hypothetical protein